MCTNFNTTNVDIYAHSRPSNQQNETNQPTMSKTTSQKQPPTTKHLKSQQTLFLFTQLDYATISHVWLGTYRQQWEFWRSWVGRDVRRPVRGSGGGGGAGEITICYCYFKALLLLTDTLVIGFPLPHHPGFPYHITQDLPFYVLSFFGVII